MAAAYAALMSLMHTSELILHPSQQWLRLHRKQIESLLQKVRFLQEFLEDYSHRGHEEMAGLERQIADVAYAAEDIIESHVLDQILARSTGSEAKSSTSFSEYIQKLIEEMEDLIKNKVMRIKETIGDSEEVRTFVDFSPAVSSRLPPSDQNTMVGSDEKLIEIMDRLTGHQLNRQIIAIVGMGGIGKTALAKNVYEHPHIKHYFHIRGWATISQKYSARGFILELLSEIDQSKPESDLSEDKLGQQLYKGKQKNVLSDEQLREQLHKSLSGMRYLIVMDDLWDIDVWYEIRALFPSNCNGSRILITTRLLNVARQLSSCRPFEMQFLDHNQSWELLCDKVFGKQGCPSELQELGKNIAMKCKGLPLAIVVIGGLLAKSTRTQEFWAYVAKDLNSIINSGDDENCLKILYLSYKHLPIHLKPCFLYMATVPEGWAYVINYITGLFITEGFLKPIRAKSLEEVVYKYLIDLMDRNLIFMRHRHTLGRSETCNMHDLLKDLGVREAQKENFFFVINKRNRGIPLEIKLKRRLFFYEAPKEFTQPGPQILDLLRPASLTRSLIGEFGWTLSLASSLRLLRVLDVDVGEFLPTGKEIMQLLNLRFMRILGTWYWYSNSMGWFTSSISQFWSLQFLYFHDFSNNTVFLPSEIWNLPQLRFLRFNRVILPDPACSHNDEHDSHILEHLQTLSTVLNFRCTKEVLKRVPNLMKLKITYDHLSPGVHWPYFCLHNLVHLHKLESLNLNALNRISLKYLGLPLSLKSLKLRGCRLPWEDMTIVGSLPYLEALELRSHAFQGLEWCPVEGEFVRLKLLAIEKTDLLHWRAEKTHFPILEHLVLKGLDLAELPRDLGELSTLRKIELFNCSDSTNTWAEQIREEQKSFGNEDLRIIIKRK